MIIVTGCTCSTARLACLSGLAEKEAIIADALTEAVQSRVGSAGFALVRTCVARITVRSALEARVSADVLVGFAY